MAFVKSASAMGSWTNPPDKVEMFGHQPLVFKVYGIPLNSLSFDEFYRTMYELTIQSLGLDSKLFENGMTNTMFSKTHSIIVFDFSGTQDMSIV